MSDFCPFIKKKCKQNDCKFYMQVQGYNPQTGHPVDKWDCAIALMPMLTIENSQQQHQTGAAVESLRNEMVAGNKEFQQLITDAAAQNRLDDKRG